jgi:dATP pyrophosphohydrolase
MMTGSSRSDSAPPSSRGESAKVNTTGVFGKKQPVSVLVVIYAVPSTELKACDQAAVVEQSGRMATGPSTGLRTGLEVLLLERADHPGYWQSVTGSREGMEALRDTAIREVFEETGIVAEKYQLTDWQVQNSYEIYPHWRHRYPAGVTQNTEHVFGLQLQERLDIRVSPREHLCFQWFSWQDAADIVFSPSNRAAILELAQRVNRNKP